MNLFESIKISLHSVKVNGMRSFLTMLGIIIGVSAVIVLVAIGEGASSNVANQVNSLGTNLIIITPGQAQQGGVKLGAGSLDTLTLNDVSALAKLKTVAGVAPELTKNSQVVWGNQNYSTLINATTEDYPVVRNAGVQKGRFFNHLEVEKQSHVAVVGPEVVSNLFGDPNFDAIGQKIQISQISFKIVGVLESQGNEGATNKDDKILIPITTSLNRIFDKPKLRNIYVSAKSADFMEQAQFDIQKALRATHHLSPKNDNDFQISSQTQILSTAQNVTSVMTALLSGIAAISLIVGGIGIMNIMLVSVTERTREIGIRKAIGARRRDILRQFLIESVTLSLMGGIAGILIGIVIALVLSKFTHLTTTLSWSPIFYSFTSSLLVGVVFGVYPARKAAGLNPIDALRYE